MTTFNEVKRKAVVGETIRITNAFGTEGKYANGDVFKVKSVRSDDSVVYVAEHDRPIHPDEFVVLEQPEYREVKRKAKAGERIRIVAPWMSCGMYRKGDEFTVKAIANGIGAIEVEISGYGSYAFVEREYVVLEPIAAASDPVGTTIDSSQYTEVKRRARAGELVRVFGHCYGPANGVFTVKEADREGRISYDKGYGTPYYDGRAYIVLEPKPPVQIGDYVRITKNQCAAPVGTVVKVVKVHDFKDKGGLRVVEYEWTAPNGVHSTGWVSGYYEPADAPKPPLVVTPAELTVEQRLVALENRIAVLEKADTPSPVEIATSPLLDTPKLGLRLTRDEIVAQAKADVAELERIGKDVHGRIPGSPLSNLFYRVEFVVDRANLTVTALVRLKYGETVWARGTAKCDPDDVFNEHIGKVIALRRALGLMVPETYLKTPKPTSAQIGNVVAGIKKPGQGYYSEDKRFTLTKVNVDGSFKYAENPADWIYVKDIGHIIEDTVSEVQA